MLLQLSIRNYAIIERLELRPDTRLNIITGETGAGKSIIMGALSLILGERADTSVLINKENKCIVEAHFKNKDNQNFKDALRNEDIDDEDICIIRREISPSGKSRAFINDSPVNLGTLQYITSLLVDLHQQFDNHQIEADDFQFAVVDSMAGNQSVKAGFKSSYKQYHQVAAQLEEKIQQQQHWQKEADYKQFLFEELEELQFGEDEIEQAEARLKQLNASGQIISTLEQARFVLDDGESPIANEIRKQVQQLQHISNWLPEAAGLYERLNSMYAEAKDIASELESLSSGINLEPEEMARLQERVDNGIKLLKKHGVQTTNELRTIHRQLSEELNATLDLNDLILHLQEEKEQVFKKMMYEGEILRASRNAIIPDIENRVNLLLTEVGMPNARFRITISDKKQAGQQGIDEISFLLDANKSGQFLPLQKAASGGELSRIALCIKSITARAMHMPTLIFDEVDSGISGQAAIKVGALLKELATYHQIICITHQAQVAAKGDAHFFVYKESGQESKINTQIRQLGAEEKILAIARMIGGEQPSEAAINNARELCLT